MKNSKSTYILIYAYTSKNRKQLIEASAEIQSFNSCLSVTKAGDVIDFQYEDFETGTVSENDTPIIQLDTVDFNYLLKNQLTFAMQQILELNNLNAEKIKGFVVATVCLKNEKLEDYYYHRAGEKMKYTFPTIDEIALDIKNLSKEVALYSNKLMNANNYS